LAEAAILVLTHMPDRDRALQLARSLVAARLAACVNIGAAVESMYHWQGKIETGHEVPLAIKTRSALWRPLQAAILARHPYELPEIIVVPIVDGLDRYLHWIAEETLAR
jgi:periplasmic divalent cation tolerance protein